MSEETVFAQFRENKNRIFNWGLQEVLATLLENLVQNQKVNRLGQFFLFKKCVLQ